MGATVQAAKVIGRVVASRKCETLEGAKLLLIQPLSWEKKPLGDPIVAVDTVGAGAEEFVFWVAAREAAVAMGGTSMKDTPPVDAAIVGIVDGVNLQEWTRETGHASGARGGKRLDNEKAPRSGEFQAFVGPAA